VDPSCTASERRYHEQRARRQMVPRADVRSDAAVPAGESAPNEVMVFASRYVLKDEAIGESASFGHVNSSRCGGAQEDAMRAIGRSPACKQPVARPIYPRSFLEDVFGPFRWRPDGRSVSLQELPKLISALIGHRRADMMCTPAASRFKYGTRFCRGHRRQPRGRLIPAMSTGWLSPVELRPVQCWPR